MAFMGLVWGAGEGFYFAIFNNQVADLIQFIGRVDYASAVNNDSLVGPAHLGAPLICQRFGVAILRLGLSAHGHGENGHAHGNTVVHLFKND